MRQSQSSVLPEITDKEKRPARSSRRPVVERIAGWSARHKKTAVFGWFLLVAVVFAGGQALGTKNLPSYDAGQSGQAERTLNQLTANANTPSGEEVLIEPRAGTGTAGTATIAAHTAAAAHETEAALAGLRASATAIQPPVWRGHSALITFTITGDQNTQSGKLARDQAAVAAVQARHQDLTVSETGDASIGKAVSDAVGSDFRKAETTTLPITLVLLLVVFGALVAAGIPLLLAGSAVMAAIALLAIPSRWLPVGGNTSEVVLIIGMAVGIDYTLFYLRREREERARGASFGEALRIAAGTSGRAIVVSGLTVMIALAGLFLTGVDEFSGIALGAIAVVGIAVAGSLTVLPALLSWLGPWADRGRIPFLGRRRAAARPSRAWAALVRRVVRHPVAWGGTAAVAMLVLAAPALGMRLGQPAVDAPASLPAVRALVDAQRTFGQKTTSPAEVVVTGTGVTDPRMTAAIAALQGRAGSTGPIRTPVTAARTGSGLVIDVPLAGNGQDATSYQALTDLRATVLPQTIGRVPGVSYAVTGNTAAIYDDTHQLHDRTPLVLAVVAALAFVLLLAAFRSLSVAVVSIGLNLLSVGAAYGIITFVFQDGRLQGPLDYTAFGGIIFWVPLFMFVFLFGLSMDYHVFILSRIRELRLRGASPRAAIVDGIASSAGVVTSAAVIMVAVFSVFGTLSLVDLKILGVGTAAAILIDATVVRGVLLPAALALLGDRAWRVNPLRRPPLDRPPVQAHHGISAPRAMPPVTAPRG
jgi:putative drug exporter of the RND superfamily